MTNLRNAFGIALVVALVVFNGASPIPFQGAGLDLEDGTVSDGGLSWASGRDGSLGTGPWIEAALTPGEHRVTLTVVDTDGNRDQAGIRLIVSASAIADRSRVCLPCVARNR